MNDREEMLKKKKLQLGIKRLFDIAASSVGLIVLSPLLLVIACAVKATSPGPVLFRQIRVGREGKEFAILKFRTMVEHAELLGEQLTVGKDPRITSVGTTLRKYKLDEFPQLINVLKGEMSLVGPRPEVPKYVALYTQEQRQVLLMRPGITSEASILYSDETMTLARAEDPEKYYMQELLPKKLLLNLSYIEHFSLLMDLKILFKTFQKIFM